jgi:hypothetical protein
VYGLADAGTPAPFTITVKPTDLTPILMLLD